METKKCPDCGEVKLRAEFGKASARPDGVQSICKACGCERARQRRKNHPDRAAAAVAKWRAKNPGHQAKTNKAFYAANREREKARAAAFRRANPEMTAATNKAWREANAERFAQKKKDYRARNIDHAKASRRANYAANRERDLQKGREYKARNKEVLAARYAEWLRVNPEFNRYARSLRRAAEKTAMPAWASRKKMRAIYAAAARLTRETGIPHHVDHEVPLQSPLVCGLHWEGNLRVLPAAANQSKSNRHWPDMPEQMRA